MTSPSELVNETHVPTSAATCANGTNGTKQLANESVNGHTNGNGVAVEMAGSSTDSNGSVSPSQTPAASQGDMLEQIPVIDSESGQAEQEGQNGLDDDDDGEESSRDQKRDLYVGNL
jgi:hypothetical protein